MVDLHPNPLICLGSDVSCVGHVAFDLIEFFSEVVGDPALPVSGFIPYFIELGVPRKKTVGHPTCLGPLKTSVRPLLDRVVRRPRYIPPTSALLCET